jgi:signal transduction histidine kinase
VLALRILIVDDSPEDRETYRRFLAADRGREVRFVEAETGEEGLQEARRERPDCVLLDYRLPDLDGLEFLRRLQSGPQQQPPGPRQASGPSPVIVLTGQGNEAVAVAAMKSGAQDYLVKDEISELVLLRAVDNAIEKAGLRAEVEARTAALVAANAELRREVEERQRAERALQAAQAALEGLVEARTQALSLANAELKREIAERRRAEQERAGLLLLEQGARRQAEEANRLKDEFLAILSHELRTPLNAILGWAHLLRVGNLDAAAAASALERIERNAKAQAKLVGDLLEVSQIITGKLRLEMSPVDLSATIDAALDSVTPAAEAKGIRISTRLDPAAPMVVGDASRLQQVVWNLLSNAIKFTPRGGAVEVSVEPAPGEVRIEVSDSGIGIAPRFLPYVFDRFRQADSSTTRTHGGLGLGLSIVRHLVELHGGTAEVESGGEGLGAVFTVALPVHEDLRLDADGTGRQTAAPAAAGNDAAAAAAAAAAAEELAGLCVLVVEDEDDTRELIARALAQAGASVAAAGSAAEALSLVDRQRPDVLICDIGMPGEDGLSLIRKLRAHADGEASLLPAAALTAYAGPADRARILAAGFQRHLAKPVDFAELRRTVAELGGRVVRPPAHG